MKPARTLHAKILNHSSGLGAPSPDEVRARAQELAMINGHTEVTEEDWRQAKRELHGAAETSANGDDEMAASVSGADMVAGSVGHHTVNGFAPDEPENVVEELIAEGMEEAMHEQMLESRKLEAAEDGEEEEL